MLFNKAVLLLAAGTSADKKMFVNGRIIGSNHRAAEETLPPEIIAACPCYPDGTDELPWEAHGDYLACVRGFLQDNVSDYTSQEVKQYKKLASQKDCGKPRIPEGFPVPTAPLSTNICEGQGTRFIDEAEVQAITCGEAIARVRPQTGGDISCGAQGELDVSGLNGGAGLTPINVPLGQTKLCVANVHFHIGAEHNSEGQFDTPFTATNGPEYTTINPFPENYTGKRCNFFEDRQTNGLNFDPNYNWKHCVDVKVGETYEFHWPRSQLAACGLYNNQYQSPFIDGLLCNGGNDFAGVIEAISDPDTGDQTLTNTIGVQGQVFTVVNDEDYYFPNLIDGMLVDEERGIGINITAYTGSRTGGGFGDQLDDPNCDPVSPVTWQVDRTCQLISASTMDKLCLDIKTRPGMARCIDESGDPCENFKNSDLFIDPDGKTCCFPDTRPGTSRGVVVPELIANNQVDIGNTCPPV